MAAPTSRQELIDYCKRQLGAPVLQINIADEQTSDIVDDAIQFYHEHHFDGLERMYLKHQITSLDVARFTTQNEVTQTVDPDATGWEHRKNFLEIPDHVMGISKVFGISSNFVRNSLFGMTNQYFLMDMFSFSVSRWRRASTRRPFVSRRQKWPERRRVYGKEQPTRIAAIG